VVLASDEHPREIKKLSDKLVSRFMAGAVVKIETPDAELRSGLIRHLAAARSMRLDDAAVKLLCDRSARSIGSLGGFGGSVRELEGLLIQIEAIHRLLPDAAPDTGEISLGLVRRALGLTAGDGPQDTGPAPALRPRRPIAAQTVIAEVCRGLNVDLSDFMGKGRHPRVVLARSVTSFVCRKLTTLSFPEIARAMGRGNHSTVITAHRRVERDVVKKDPLPADLAPNHAGCTLMELIDAMSKTIVRNAAGI
jgi:chromosomal replication initiator protein